jgi:hypothetical protein
VSDLSEAKKTDSTVANRRPEEEVAHAPAAPAPSLSEVAYRFSGGARGTAPLGRMAEERRNVVASAAARIMRKASGVATGNAKIPDGPGSALPSDVRKSMESKLGADLSGVRVHTGADSAKAATGYGARAFTVGQDIHFNSGQFSPGTKEGDRLLAHELTHVVQGQKSGVARKAEQGEEKGGAPEVSKPEEPAEQEADLMGDRVAEEMHGGGGEKGDKKDKGGKAQKDGQKDGEKGEGKDADAKEAGAEEKEGAAAEGKEGEEKGEKKKISAKLDGVGTKLWRAPAPGPAPVGGPAGQFFGVDSKLTVAPALEKTADPNSFPSSVAKYEANFATVKANIAGRGGTPDQVARFEAKKSDWYRRWAVAAMQTNADAAKVEFANIYNDLKAIFPDDKPSAGGGHLYTGYAAGGSGRARAEDAAATANADPANQAAGITHRTLETTLVGNMFDGVASNQRDPNEQKKWIPYSASQVSAWWSGVSAAYANTFVGEVTAHVDIGMPWFVSNVGKGKPADERKKMTSELQAVIALQSSVFRDDELPRIAALMGDGKVTALKVNLRIEVTPGNIKTLSPTIPGTGIASAAQLIAMIDGQIKGAVTVADILPNIT